MSGASVVGMDKDELVTPALWVDLDAFESNVQRLTEYFRTAGVGWRPHFKGLRVPALAHKQIAAGAIGVSCTTLAEAEAAVEAGIPSVLITNEIVGPQKIARLVALLQGDSEVIVCVDNAENVRALSLAAHVEDVQLSVLVDVDVGLNRCGVLPGEPSLVLAKLAHDAPNLIFRGLMGYEGHTELILDPDERRPAIEESVRLVIETADLCRASGLLVEIISCASSVTYPVTAHIPGVTEIQAGGVTFMDVVYRSLGADLDYSLFIRATVISRPTPTRAVVDAGRKKMGCVYVARAGDTPGLSWALCPVAMPQPRNVPGVRLKALNAEHGILELVPTTRLQVGDTIDFIAGYVDFTVFHHSKLYGVRKGRIEEVWDILAR